MLYQKRSELRVAQGRVHLPSLAVSPCVGRCDLMQRTRQAETAKSAVAVDAAFEAGPATVGVKTKVSASGKVSGTEASCQMAAGSVLVAGKYELDKSGTCCLWLVCCRLREQHRMLDVARLYGASPD